MTYPPQQPGPQGPWPGQQGPYGPPPGHPPQQGGYPPAGYPHGGYQQPGGYPQAGPQQPGQFGQPGWGPHGGYGPGYPGGGGKPPKKTGLIAGLAVAAALVVAAVLITGLAAPGWMLGDDEPDPRPQAAVQDSPTIVVRRVIDAVNKRDTAAATREVCSDSEAGLLADPLPQGVTLRLEGEVQQSGNSAKAVVNSELGKFNAQLSKRDDGWCVTDVGAEVPSATIPTPSLPGG